ncbi:MAG: AsnC family protein [Desulfurococcales archaeon]|nr:AsnC family protein [Desulfurococcales archaeon]
MDLVAVIVISGVSVGFALLLFVSLLFKSAHTMIAEVGDAGAVKSEVASTYSEALDVKPATVGGGGVVHEEAKPAQQKTSTKSKKSSRKTRSIDARILELRRKGLSIKKIAKEVGLSPSTVSRRLRKLASRRK